MSRTELLKEIQCLKPWHQVIQITEEVSSATPFTDQGSLSERENDGVALLSLWRPFRNFVDKIYPNGLTGKTFLDCACNAGAYCFWARELNADRVVGFDAREHWINQARFVRSNRRTAPTDRIELHVCDLYDVPNLKLPQFDFTVFKGLYYHLPDPILGLKIAADLTKDVLWFNTAFTPRSDFVGLVQAIEGTNEVMSGVHGLSYFPTHPHVISEQLRWLGFEDIRLLFSRKNKRLGRHGGRMSIVAAREDGRLDALRRIARKLPPRVNEDRLKELLFFDPQQDVEQESHRISEENLDSIDTVSDSD